MDANLLDRIILSYKNPSGRILGILEDIQEQEKYLSKESLKYVASSLKIPLSRLYGIATFYSFFNLNPVGEHIISVCMGTACHVKGAPEILENLEYLLGVNEGEVTEDGKFMLTTYDKRFSLNTARCFGCCSMAPVIKVNDRLYGYVSLKELPKILKEYGWNR